MFLRLSIIWYFLTLGILCVWLGEGNVCSLYVIGKHGDLLVQRFTGEHCDNISTRLTADYPNSVMQKKQHLISHPCEGSGRYTIRHLEIEHETIARLSACQRASQCLQRSAATRDTLIRSVSGFRTKLRRKASLPGPIGPSRRASLVEPVVLAASRSERSSLCHRGGVLRSNL